jgi:hypothetical protein
MKTYKRFYDARSQSRRPLYALLDGQGCWLVKKPVPHVIESTSFRAILSRGLSDLTRSFELGQTEGYYSSICRGVGENDLIHLYLSEEQARQHYEEAVSRHNSDSSHWQRVH